MDKQRHNWMVDAVLYAGLLAAMLLDLTGLAAHEWLGAAVAVLAGYHLLVHRRWMVGVGRRFGGRLSGHARGLFLIDLALLVGFAAIGGTGVVISTWLDLPLDNYLTWRNVHVVASVLTLALVVLKIGLHWRWVVMIAPRGLLASRSGAAGLASASQDQLPSKPGRREFVRLMGVVSVVAVLASAKVVNDLLAGNGSSAPVWTSLAGDTNIGGQVAITAVSLTSGVPTAPTAGASVPTPASASTQSASAATPQSVSSASSQPQASVAQPCVVRCPSACSYPGLCRRYVDANKNRRCDLGECLA